VDGGKFTALFQPKGSSIELVDLLYNTVELCQDLSSVECSSNILGVFELVFQ
jgi:hypothetical protein